MKYTLIAAVTTLALTSPALAQTTIVTPPPPGGGVAVTSPRAGVAVTIAPEQRTRIKQYVVQNEIKPYPMRERLAVGTTVPADVELFAVPNDWGPGLVQYRYVYSGNSIGLVDSSSRRSST